MPNRFRGVGAAAPKNRCMKAPTVMSLLSLLYVSRSTIGSDGADAAVDHIVETARRVNPDRKLTGALIFTGSNFAQILEGLSDAVDTMMASIHTDPRHDSILIADRVSIADRRFLAWSMAYFGRVKFVGHHITQLLDSRSAFDRSHYTKLLAKLIHQLSQE